MPIEPGELLYHRYLIEGILAQGGFGAVYKAVDQSLGLRCAVKENRSVSAASERQFRREARLLATLRHPHLPRVTNHFVSVGSQYLVMDLIEGEDLAHLLQHQGRMSEDLVMRWFDQICDALAYMHAQDPPVIHRDIKPANIKIAPSDEAMLVDFGLAKAGGAGYATSTGAKGITPGFAPPEQYDLGHTDVRSDIYALGATLYALLTGLYPPESIERLIGEAMLVPPEWIRPDLSPHLAATIVRSMELASDKRFQSIEEFVTAMASPDYRYEPQDSTRLGEANLESSAEPAAESADQIPKKVGILRGPKAIVLGSIPILAILAAIIFGSEALTDLARSWIGDLVDQAVLPALESMGEALFVGQTPSTTPRQPVATRVAAATATTLPTPTPRPEIVMVENAGQWRLFTHWEGGVQSVPFAMNPEGDALLLVSRQGVDVFDLLSGERVEEVQGFVIDREVYQLAHLGSSFLIQFADEILRYEFSTKNMLDSIHVSGRNMAVTLDGNMLAVQDEYVSVIDLATEQLIATLGQKDAQQEYTFSPNGLIFALTDRDHVDLYDSSTGKNLQMLVGHGEPTQALEFSKDGRYLVSASGDVWDIRSGELISTFDSSTSRIAISPNAQVIVGDDGSVWSLASGDLVGRIPLSDKGSLWLQFTPDGRFLVRHARGGEVEVWTVDPNVLLASEVETSPATLPTGEEISPMNVSRLAPIAGLGESWLGGLAISPNWKTAAIWGGSSVTIISLASGEGLQRIQVSGRVLDIDYLGDDFIVLINAFRRVERWEVSTGSLKQTYDFFGHTIVASPAANLFAVQEKYIQVVDPLSGERMLNLGSAVRLADNYAKVGVQPSDEPSSSADSGLPYQDFAFSPNGDLLAITTGSAVGLWEMASGTRVAHLSGHGPKTRGLVFTADGSRLLSSSGDIWDIDTGERTAAFDTQAVFHAIAPHGKLIVADDGSLWEGEGGHYIGNLGIEASALWFTPNNQQLVIHSVDGEIEIFGIEPKAAHVSPSDTRRQATDLLDIHLGDASRINLIGWWGEDQVLAARNGRDHAAPHASFFGKDRYKHLALASDEVLAGLGEQGVDFLDPSSGRLIDSFRIFMNPETIQEIAFLGDDLLVLKEQAGIERWDLTRQDLIQRYPLTGEALTPSPQGDRFVLVQGNRLQLVEAASGEVQAYITVSPGAQNASFSKDGRLLAVVRGPVAELWDTEAKRRIRILHGHASQVYGLAFSPDSSKLLAASGDVWDVSSGDRLLSFDSDAQKIAISPAGQIVACDDGALREFESGQRIATLVDLRAPADQLLAMGDGREIVLRSGDGRVFVWGVRSDSSLAASPQPGAPITAEQISSMAVKSHLGRGRLQDAVWSSNERYLAINTSLNTLIFQVDPMQLMHKVLGARIVGFDQQGHALLGGAHTLQLIDPDSGEIIRDFHLRGVARAAFSPDGEQLAVAGRVSPDGSEDGLALISLENGDLRVLDPGRGIFGQPIGLEFAPNSRILVLSFYGTIKIWDLETENELRQPIQDNVRAARISPDGQHIAYLTHRFVVENLQKGGQYRAISSDGTPFFPTGFDVPVLEPLDFDFTQQGRLLVFYRRLNRRNFEEDLTLIEWDIHDQPVSANIRLESFLSLSNLAGIYMEDYENEHPRRVPALGLSPDGTYFYSLTGDGLARIWNAESGVSVGSSLPEQSDLMALRPDGEAVAVPNSQGAIDILSLTSGDLIRSLTGSWSPEWLNYSSPSVLMLLDDAGALHFLDTTLGSALEEVALDRHAGLVNFALAPDGRQYANLALSGGSSVLQLYSLGPSIPLADLDRYPLARQPVFSPDGDTLAMVRRDRVELWDLSTHTLGQELEGLGASIGPLTFTPDGVLLIAASGEIWDLALGTLALQFETTDPSMLIGTNGEIVVGQDGSLWDLGSGDKLGVLPDMLHEAVNFTFSPDGARLIWQVSGGVIEIWEARP